MALSEARAEKVRKILDERLQIEPGRISVTGFADSKPVGESAPQEGIKNSSVEVIITHMASVDEHLTPSEEEKKRQDEFIKSQSMSEYKVGPGDILKIVFWKQFSADEYEVLIRPDGTLSLFMVDDLPVGGLTLPELDRLLTEKLRRYFKNPRIDITIKEFHSQEVMILGAINSLPRQPTGPGVYVLTKPTKIVELLTIAGGPLPTANLKKVTVTRKNGTTLSVNLYKAIFQSNASEDIPIYPGDSIFVPETSEGMSKVYVFGEVKNPGIYDLKEGMSVLDVVGKAGSFTEDAVIQSTHLIRGDLSKPEVIPVDVKRFFQKGDLSANLILQNNDIIYVPKSRIASVSYLLTKIKPMLDFVLFPYQFESMRTTIDLNKENVRPLTTP
jgi:polysaccharide export outer membrane protein